MINRHTALFFLAFLIIVAFYYLPVFDCCLIILLLSQNGLAAKHLIMTKHIYLLQEFVLILLFQRLLCIQNPLQDNISHGLKELDKLIIKIIIMKNFHTRRASQSASKIITPGHWALIHSLNHLSSLGSIQPVKQICATRLNQSQEPSLLSQVPI